MTYNASQQKSPVHYSLEDSPYWTDFGDYVYKFSSIKHKEKFEREVHERILWLDDSLSRRFHLCINTGDLAAVQLYMQIEGRGFCIYDKALNKYCLTPDNIEFDVMSYV